MITKQLVETIKHNGILASAGELKKLFTKAVEAEEKNIELEKKLTDLAVQLANAESKCRELAAENAAKQEFIATCFRAAADGGSMDGADIQELGERLGLFGRETYQPVLHGYICGHEAGEDTVYVMKKTQSTDAFLAEVRAQGVDVARNALIKFVEDEVGPNTNVPGLIRGAEVCVSIAAQLRKGAAL